MVGEAKVLRNEEEIVQNHEFKIFRLIILDHATFLDLSNDLKKRNQLFLAHIDVSKN